MDSISKDYNNYKIQKLLSVKPQSSTGEKGGDKKSDTENHLPYREDGIIQLHINEKRVYKKSIATSPYIIDNESIQIYPSETINIEATIKNGKIDNLKPVKNVKHPDKTIIVSFQQKLVNNKYNMVMTIKNPFSQSLIFKSKVSNIKGEKWSKTKRTLVKPYQTIIKSWDKASLSMIFSNLEVEKLDYNGIYPVIAFK